MKLIFSLVIILLSTALFAQNKSSIYDFTVTDIDGNAFKLSELKGSKIMIVNTASECGYTPQYEELEAIYTKYKDKKFVILGFPCNDFGNQEPDDNATIKSFCKKNYGVTFPMMNKISTKGEAIAPLYNWLCSAGENGVLDAKVKWNFTKFLIDENGKVVKCIASDVSPADPSITNWIEGN